MARPLPGPRSLTRTVTVRPLRGLVTLSRVWNGRVGCAAVSSLGLKRSPLAVRWPRSSRPYHEAMPREQLGAFSQTTTGAAQ
jgi:hypothetical protein